MKLQEADDLRKRQIENFLVCAAAARRQRNRKAYNRKQKHKNQEKD